MMDGHRLCDNILCCHIASDSVRKSKLFIEFISADRRNVVSLFIKEKIVNSRLLPFRFATAYSEIEKMVYDNKEPKTKITFESDGICKQTRACKIKINFLFELGAIGYTLAESNLYINIPACLKIF